MTLQIGLSNLSSGSCSGTVSCFGMVWIARGRSVRGPPGRLWCKVLIVLRIKILFGLRDTHGGIHSLGHQWPGMWAQENIGFLLTKLHENKVCFQLKSFYIAVLITCLTVWPNIPQIKDYTSAIRFKDPNRVLPDIRVDWKLDGSPTFIPSCYLLFMLTDFCIFILAFNSSYCYCAPSLIPGVNKL